MKLSQNMINTLISIGYRTTDLIRNTRRKATQ